MVSLANSSAVSEYRRALEQSPMLLDVFERVRANCDVRSLRDEAALMRTYIFEVQRLLARAHAANRQLGPAELQLALNIMSQGIATLDRCAAVEQRRDDRTSPEELTAALLRTREKMVQRLTEAGQLAALPIIDEVLGTFQVTTGQRPLAQRLLGDADIIEVGFRAIKRVDRSGQVSMAAIDGGELEREEADTADVALAADVLTEKDAAALYGLANGNGHSNGNGNGQRGHGHANGNGHTTTEQRDKIAAQNAAALKLLNDLGLPQ